ncbi:3'-5' exonuclease [Nostoc sp.]|uniref:3'-5' exonuclease n=1 Tax=Nostoc sp. TaxID=1180 RepID=UPI002FF795AD
MQQYNYWGYGTNEPPAHLKSKKQLSEIGLAPANPVGFIDTKKYTLYLYDPDLLDSAKPKREPTPKQLENLKKGRAKSQYRAWYRNGGFVEEDRARTVGWARELLEKGTLILDTETTGLGNAEIVEIAIINHQGETLLNTLVQPTIEIPGEVIAIHGITNEMVRNAPSFPEIYPKIKEVLADNTIAIYNADADMGFLRYCCKLHGLKSLKLRDRTVDLMEYYACWYGEYSSYWRDYKWQPLNGGHRALSDCLAALEVLKEMAADDPQMRVPDFGC